MPSVRRKTGAKAPRHGVARKVAQGAEARLAADLTRWFRASARDLPWRLTDSSGRRDPYRALVSEFMLQQTQVSRVLEKFEPFLARFPTVASLAAAPERDVLAAWSGLGYYRRAKLLHGAAKAIITEFGGEIPGTAEELRRLPGVGRYTAGAIASIVFGAREALVDGNVSRVLMRLSARRGTAAEGAEWAWERAEGLVAKAKDPAAFNEGLMELGATVCTPSSPRCQSCPLRGECAAFAEGSQGEIPSPKRAAKRRALYCASVLVEDGAGRLLVEQRPAKGLWASMFQAPTVESDTPLRASVIERRTGIGPLRRIAAFDHGTTHRDVTFTVFAGPTTRRGARQPASLSAGAGAVFMTRTEIAMLALSNPQRRVLFDLSRP